MSDTNAPPPSDAPTLPAPSPTPSPAPALPPQSAPLAESPPPPAEPVGSSHAVLRTVAIAVALSLVSLAVMAEGLIPPKLMAALGVVALMAFLAACSTNIAAIRLRTVACGLTLQVGFALLVLKGLPFDVHFEIAGRPLHFGGMMVYEFFQGVASVIAAFLGFTAQGASFVFGELAGGPSSKVGFVFAFVALPTIVFVSSFFTVLYYYGVLQLIVRLMARVMMSVMGTSGAETLSAAANVFMGQTEAPLIVKPYVPTMTRSEILAMMVGGMATISGGIMAALVGMFPADQREAVAVAILTTSIMAAPCGLYVAKILVPETQQPATAGSATVQVQQTHANAVDAASAGASDGMALAINVAAMLIAFLALVAMTDALLAKLPVTPLTWIGLAPPQDTISLAWIFSLVFRPIALLMGTAGREAAFLADLLGTKLVVNEFVAFVKLSQTPADQITPQTRALATFALTGFANIGSIGIQIGGIGGMAPGRRGDIARMGGLCLLGGFTATIINACIASILL